ncbi:MAG TPA: ATP-binding protein [Verrucomicrobiae bacterium]|nr:ATP-binding protein [Verrucomicrobiae bacterium]
MVSFLNSSWKQYLCVGIIFLGVTVINVWLEKWIGYQAVALVYLLTVVVMALFINRGPILLVTILTAGWWNFYFAPPRYAFVVTDGYDRTMLLTYFVVTLTVGHLTTHLRAQRLAEKQREEHASALYQLTRVLAKAADLDEIFCRSIENIRAFFAADVAFLLPNLLAPHDLTPYTASLWSPREKEFELAADVFAQNRPAGRGTKISATAEGLYWPMSTDAVPMGVVALRFKRETLTPQQFTILEDVVREIGLIVERQRLRDVELSNKFLAESERLARTLLNSVSHELRTPIAAISSAASSLQSSGTLSTSQHNLTSEIESASVRLNRVIQSLLSAARLQSGQLRPKLELYDVSDIVQVTLRNVATMIAGHPIQTNITADLPLIKADFVLMEQVVANLVVNAATHTPAGTPIEISASAVGSEVVLSVADRGSGVPPDQLGRIFDLFHRAPDAKPGGTGLGLAIVKGFIETQGGRVSAANRPGGGAMFSIYLPATEMPDLVEETL